MGRVRFLWGIIFILILLYISSWAYFLSQDTREIEGYGKNGDIAKIGNETITTNEFFEKLVDRFGETILQDMINRKLIASEAKRLNITISEKEIDKETEVLRKDYESEEQFYESLSHQVGINQEELKDEIRYYLLTEEMATRDIVISTEELKAYYEQNIDSYYIPTRFHLHRIVVATEEEARQAMKEMDQGSSFEAVAAERSLDMITSTAGGDMGFVTAEDFFLPDELIQVAEEIPLDTISDPIHTEEGYVLIKVSERVAGKQSSFDEVRSKIRRELALKQLDGIHSFVEKLRDNVGVEVYLKGDVQKVRER